MIWLMMLQTLGATQSADISTVSRFLTMIREEPNSASAMLTEDATAAFGDVGFPLTVDVFEMLSAEGCTFQGEPRPYEAAPSADAEMSQAVVSDLICAGDQGGDGGARQAIFVLDGQKIAGVLFTLEGSEAPESGRQSPREH